MSISSNVFPTLQHFGVIKQGKCLMKERAERGGINFKKHPAIKFRSLYTCHFYNSSVEGKNYMLFFYDSEIEN